MHDLQVAATQVEPNNGEAAEGREVRGAPGEETRVYIARVVWTRVIQRLAVFGPPWTFR